MPAQHDSSATTSTSGALVTTATSQPALRTGFMMLGLASLLDLSTGRRGGGADRMLAIARRENAPLRRWTKRLHQPRRV